MIIILGSTGFIGKSLCNHFSKIQFPYKGFSSKEIDLTKKTSVKKLSKIFNSETILIFASSITKEKGDNIENMQKNIDMVKNVLCAIKIKPVKKIVFISSIDVYGKPAGKINEQTPINPLSPYGVSKFTSESLLKILAKSLKIPLLILRLGGIFGPNQSPKKYGPNSFIYSLKRNSPVNIFGDGSEKRDLVFIFDLVKIISQLSFSKSAGIVNIASGNQISFMEILTKIKNISNQRIKIFKRKRGTKKINFIFDNSKLLSLLPENFKFTTYEKALKITIDSSV